jgi:hypothetical protein
MQTFEEWLITNHPESLDENWRQTMGALALAGASFLPGANAQAAPPTAPRVAATQSVSQNQQARLDATKRVSSVHRFKKNWGSKFGPQQDQKLFDTIMRLQTEKDHDDVLAKITKDQQDLMRGTAHPDPSVQQSEVRQIYNSFDYQYMDYIKALTTASKNNL